MVGVRMHVCMTATNGFPMTEPSILNSHQELTEPTREHVINIIDIIQTWGWITSGKIKSDAVHTSHLLATTT